MDVAIRIVFSAVLIVAVFLGARFLDTRWRTKYPEEKSFVWGYFQALLFFPGGLLLFLALLLDSPTSWTFWLSLAVYGIAGSFAGYELITKKKKWAWIFVVIAQLNLVTWLIDVVYGGKRWKEFR